MFKITINESGYLNVFAYFLDARLQATNPPDIKANLYPRTRCGIQLPDNMLILQTVDLDINRCLIALFSKGYLIADQ